jgi:glycosyltransferase involved in cell wall biosynthesis
MPISLTSDSTVDYFDSAWYLQQYSDVQMAGVDPHEHFITHGRMEGRLPYELTSLILERKLLFGFSDPALKELNALFKDEKNSFYERSYASWVIAQWHIAHDQWVIALPYLVFSYTSPAKPYNSFIVATCLIEAFTQTQQPNEAQAILQKSFSDFEQHQDLYLCAGNILARTPSSSSVQMQLQCINKVYDKSQLSTLTSQDPSSPISLDNLISSHAQLCLESTPKVTVIVPAFNSANYILTALRGLQKQTWKNLEVIIIDDCSGDDTVSITESFAKSDLRFKVYRQTSNQGAYAARNTALQYATGDFIINHDSDDWSHPQRIQLQVEHLLCYKNLIGVMTSWVRTEPNLYFPRWKTDTNLIHISVSTLMVRKEVFNKLRHWDLARAGADSEFLDRLKAVWGKSCIGTLLPNAPLVLARVLPTSLTNASSTHLRTQHGGVRKIYNELASRWRLRDMHTDPHTNSYFLTRRTKVPVSLRAQTSKSNKPYDFALYDDFSQAQPDDPRLQLINEMFSRGLNVGIFHWPLYSTFTHASIASAFLDQVLDGSCDLFSPKEIITAENLLILNPAILAASPDFLPFVKFNKSKIVDPHKFSLNNTHHFTDLEDDIHLLRHSIYFSEEWYLDTYSDVAKSKVDPVEHYLTHGAMEGRRASPNFDCDRYLSYFPKPLKLAIPPLLHYLRIGIKFDIDPTYPTYSGIPFRAGKASVMLCGHASNTELFGAELSFLDLLASYRKNSVNIVATLPSSANQPYINLVRQNCFALHIIPCELWSQNHKTDNYAVEKFRHLISHYNIDFIHVNTIMLREPLIASRQTAADSYVHVRESVAHDSTLCNHIGLTPDQIIDSVHLLADNVIANSLFTLKTFYKPNKTYLVRNAINADAFSLPNKINPDCISIALISSNLPKKGIYDFVRIAEQLEQQVPHARFMLIGPSNEHTKKIHEHFVNLPTNLIVSQYADSPEKAILQANIVLNLSHFEETFGRTILEAMAAGRPVIAYNHGALSELICHGIDGFLAPYLDILAVCDFIKILCSNPQKISSMGAQGKKKALESYSLQSMADQLKTIYSASPEPKT